MRAAAHARIDLHLHTATAFGGNDLKTLYITTQGTKSYEVTVNVPGVVQ